MLFQLGACSCGCLEHNVWVQLIGIDSDHHEEDFGSTADHLLVSDDHDCSGEPKAQYFDNSRSTKTKVKTVHCFAIPPAVIADSYYRLNGKASWYFFQHRECSALLHALSLPALQVYLL